MAKDLLQNIKGAAHATIEALNRWDHDALVSVRTDDFVFQGLPSSLQLPPMDNEQFRGMWFNFMVPTFREFKIEPRFIAHDVEARKSTICCAVQAQTPVGFRSWELIMMLTHNETGEKIKRIDEFFDSKFYEQLKEEIHAEGKDGNH